MALEEVLDEVLDPNERVVVTVMVVLSVLVAVSVVLTVSVTVLASIVEVSVSVMVDVSVKVEAGRGSPVTTSVVVVGRQPEAQTVVVLDAVAVFVMLAVFVTGLGVAYSSGQ